MYKEGEKKEIVNNVFIIGAKSIGQYGGYETFLDKLTEVHQEEKNIKYHIVTKAQGDGAMNETCLSGVKCIKKDKNGFVRSFIYHNAKVVKLDVPQIGPSQAIIYDVKAFRWCIKYIEDNSITDAIIYVLACRLGPFFRGLVKKAHGLGCKVYVNPDGHEWKRSKWSPFVRKYWKLSEGMMVKSSDLLICDSVNIEKYIKKEYAAYNPRTVYVAYGADLSRSSLLDDDQKFLSWLAKHGIRNKEYYMCCGRFVPENSFETMIREFMKSSTSRDFVIITTENRLFQKKLEKKLHWMDDKRIKFVGTVYDKELLKKIRENAYGNIHGHKVGGTNPSLLEALGSTELNLLLDVGFNREVAEESALYWSEKYGSLSELIDRVDVFTEEDRINIGIKAKNRIRSCYSWKKIGEDYMKVWENSNG